MTKNFFYNVLLSIVNILFPILSFPYASRILGPHGIGKVQFIISLAQYFALFAALGIPIYGITQAARYKDDKQKLSTIFTELTAIFFIASLLLFVFYLITIFSFPFFASDRPLYIYAGILILLSFCYTDWYYSGIQQFKIIAIRSIIVKILSLTLLYVFVRTENDFKQYLLIIVFSILGNQLFGFLMIARNTDFRFTGIDLQKHFKPLLFIFGATIAASIYTVLDTVLLGFLSNETAVGLYTASTKLIKLTIPFVTSMGVILIPVISKNFAENNMKGIKESLDKSFNFLVCLAVPIGAGMAILAPEFIAVFSGSRFAEATKSMQILSLLPLLIGFGHFFSYQILIPAGKNKEIFYSMLIGVLVSLTLNFILVPYLKETGAAIANVFTEFMVTMAYFYFIRRHFELRYNWRLLGQSLVSILSFYPIILSVRHLNIGANTILLITIPICACIYLWIQLYIFRNSFIFAFMALLKNKFPLNKS